MLGAGNSELGELDIKRGIFLKEILCPSVFVLALIPLSLILRNAKAVYEFSGIKGKINNLLFMDDLRLYSRNEKEFEVIQSLIQKISAFSEDIGMEFDIEKSPLLVIKKGKIVNQLV